MSSFENNGGIKALFPGYMGLHKGRRSLFLPGTCSINPPLTATLGMGVLHQIITGWALLTAAGHSSCSVFHAVPGCWLPFQNGPRTPGESGHLGGQRSSEGEGRGQTHIEGPFSDLAETIPPEEQWECHCKAGCSILRAAKHSTVRKAASASATNSVRISLAWTLQMVQGWIKS